VTTHRLGALFAAPLDVKFSIYSVVQPDLLFVCQERAEIVTEDYIDGAPDLVIEILSPSNRAQDLVKKAALYAQHGVTEYWIVDPESETISVNILQGGRYIEVASRGGVAQSTVLPGLAIPAVDIFSVPDWLKPTEQEPN
jgi:Uma2 family endonuclease